VFFSPNLFFADAEISPTAAGHHLCLFGSQFNSAFLCVRSVQPALCIACSSAAPATNLRSSAIYLRSDRRRVMAERWSVFLGSWEPFADAVAPFLTNKDLFQLSVCCLGVLGLRYTLGRWSAVLDDASYGRFCIMRYSVPPCFDLEAFDLVGQLGQRLFITLSVGCVNNETGVTSAPHYVDALAGVYNLNLAGQRITDVRALGGVHTLNLRHCTGMTNVSALGDVHTLNLWACMRITDVSALGGVHKLDLRHCTGMTDVSALGGVHTLDLFGCMGIRDVSALVGVHTLNLSDCTGIRDVSALGGVCTPPRALTSLTSVPVRSSVHASEGAHIPNTNTVIKMQSVHPSQGTHIPDTSTVTKMQRAHWILVTVLVSGM
jgi:hypothetical protein